MVLGKHLGMTSAVLSFQPQFEHKHPKSRIRSFGLSDVSRACAVLVCSALLGSITGRHSDGQVLAPFGSCRSQPQNARSCSTKRLGKLDKSVTLSVASQPYLLACMVPL